MRPIRTLLIVLLLSVGAGVSLFASDLASGSWYTSLTFNVQSATMTALDARLTEVYRIDQLTLQGSAAWKMEGGTLEFDSLKFKADFPFGDLITIDSTLMFDPNAPSLSDVFNYWRTSVQFTLAGFAFVHTLHLTEPQTSSYQTLTVRGTIGEVAAINVVRSEMNANHTWCFASNDLNLKWEWCDVPITSTVSFNQDGFQGFTIRASRYPLPGLVSDDIGLYLDLALRFTVDEGLYLDLALRFTVDEKTLAPTLRLKSPWFGCMKLMAEISTGAGGTISVDGANIYGLELSYRFPDGTTVKETASFDPAKNLAVTGQSDYWELLLLSGGSDSCCGGSSWSLATYFQAAHTTLFDWGMTVFKWEKELGEQLDLFAEVTLRSGTFGDPTTEIVLGGTTRW